MKYNLALLVLLTYFQWANAQNISSEPDWSPDGKSFVYTYGNGNSNLFIYSIEDNSNVQVTFSEGAVANPAWSPSGKYIAFVSTHNGNRDLYYYDIEKKKSFQLTQSKEIEATPSWWSNDKMSFVRFDPSDKSRKIYKIDLAGSETEFVPDKTLQAIYPILSPKKDILVFGGKPINGKELFHMYAKNVSTGVVKQIENLPTVSYNPSWFPDGNKVAFINQSGQEVSSAAIYSYNFENEQLLKVLECQNGCYHPRVSPNGEQILYLDGWGKDNLGIFTFDLATKKSTKIK